MTDPGEHDARVAQRMEQIRTDESLRLRYDVTRDGKLDEHEWELVRRIVDLEIRTAEERGREYRPDFEREVLRDRYEVVGLLGRGGQAETFLARDLDRDGEHVVAKILEIRVASDWKSIELFEREAAVLEQLDHPAIPKYVDHFHLDGDGTVRFVLVQDYVDGRDLGHRVEEGHLWSPDEARRRLLEAAEILEYLHDRNPPVVHRDIKPSNLIVSREDDLYLVDFGAAQNIIPATAGGTTVVGTSGYVPMEQYMGRAVGASDLYALGATAVHMLTGRHPADLDIVRSRLQFERYVDDEALRRLLGRLLEPHVEMRLDTARELLDRLSSPDPPPSSDGDLDREAVERFLASGLFEGIGPVLASRVVEHFGDDALDVLSEEPRRIAEVPGLGEAKAETFARAWEELDPIRSGHHVEWRGQVRTLQRQLERATALAKPLPEYVAASSPLSFEGDASRMEVRFRTRPRVRLTVTTDGVTITHQSETVILVMWLVYIFCLGALMAFGVPVPLFLLFAIALAVLPLMGHAVARVALSLDRDELVLYPLRGRYPLRSVRRFERDARGLVTILEDDREVAVEGIGPAIDDSVIDVLNRVLERLRPHQTVTRALMTEEE